MVWSPTRTDVVPVLLVLVLLIVLWLLLALVALEELAVLAVLVVAVVGSSTIILIPFIIVIPLRPNRGTER